MAFMNSERKAQRMPAIKAVLKKYNMKGTVSVRHYSTLVVTLTSGPLALTGVNPYWIEEHYAHDTVARDFLLELKAAMLGDDYFDHSDIQTDYFHCSHYIDIKVGKWNKEYVYTGSALEAA